MKTEINAFKQKCDKPDNSEEIMTLLNEIKKDVKSLRTRMVSLESWMAALSKGKNLDKSHAFAKDINDLKNILEPTICIDHCK